jgi:hypothetical protein
VLREEALRQVDRAVQVATRQVAAAQVPSYQIGTVVVDPRLVAAVEDKAGPEAYLVEAVTAAVARTVAQTVG